MEIDQVLPAADGPPVSLASPLADKWTRVSGYVIDVLPVMILGLFGLIPIIGIVIAGLLITPYWLLRDAGGRSLGKVLLGMKVVSKDGGSASIGARIVRNLPIAAGPAFMIIPLLGYFLAPPVAFVLILVEAILLLSQGSRLGDRLAGTIVVKTSNS
jgi:uncharacterized RDD family membrane protein YckC